MTTDDVNKGGRPTNEEEERLKAQCRDLGIDFHPRLGVQKLRELIAEHTGRSVGGVLGNPNGALPEGTTIVPGGKPFYTEKEWNQRQTNAKKQEAGKLVRCQITCMNPNKKNWTGEIISVGSSKVGTFKKFIPFNSDEPYHIPVIIYQELKSRKCAVRTSVKGPNGQDVVRTKLINEFSIQVLPPLTQRELEDLKQRQAMANGTAA